MKKTKMINKKGFTLSELLMVIAIIVILSGATMIGVVSTINKTRENAAKLEENNGDNFESEAMMAVESAKGTAPSHVVNQEKVDTPTPAETTQTPAETTKTPAETTKTPAETTRAPAETTQAPAETTKAPVETTKTQGGGSQAVTMSGNTTPRGSAQQGVISIDQNPDGSTTLSVFHSQWQDGDIRIWKNPDGTYDVQGLRNAGDVLGNAFNKKGVSFNWDPINSGSRFTMTNAQANALASLYGFTLN